jgi:hypothetical protein
MDSACIAAGLRVYGYVLLGWRVCGCIQAQNYGTEWLSCPSITARWLHGRIALFG